MFARNFLFKSLALHFQGYRNQWDDLMEFPPSRVTMDHPRAQHFVLNCHLGLRMFTAKVVNFTSTHQLTTQEISYKFHLWLHSIPPNPTASLWSSARQLEACLANNKHYDLHKLPTLDRIICLLGTGMLGWGWAIVFFFLNVYVYNIHIYIYVHILYIYACNVM